MSAFPCYPQEASGHLIAIINVLILHQCTLGCLRRVHFGAWPADRPKIPLVVIIVKQWPQLDNPPFGHHASANSVARLSLEAPVVTPLPSVNSSAIHNRTDYKFGLPKALAMTITIFLREEHKSHPVPSPRGIMLTCIQGVMFGSAPR